MSPRRAMKHSNNNGLVRRRTPSSKVYYILLFGALPSGAAKANDSCNKTRVWYSRDTSKQMTIRIDTRQTHTKQLCNCICQRDTPNTHHTFNDGSCN